MEAVSVSGAGVFQLPKVRKIPVCREQGDSRLSTASLCRTGFLSKGYPYVAALIAACLFTIGCFSNSNSTRLNGSSGAITVTVAPSATTVQINTTATFIATLTNDTSNLGVNWALSGKGCTGTGCGSISSTGSVSGAPITYSAPSALPNPATVTLTATSVSDGTKSASATITLSATAVISVAVVPITATVAPGATQQIYATVSNDPANKGVNWTLSGNGCTGPACGTISATSSASSAPIIYTAPATPPTPNTVTITAASVTDSSQSATATITLSSPAITLSVSPANATVATSATAQFPATLTNDTANAGVTWTLSGLGCAGGGCGSVSPAATLTGVATTYTAPGYVPSSTVTLTARSISDPTKISIATILVTAAQGNALPALARNNWLSGNYIFVFHGFNASGAISYGGILDFNGSGQITSGVEDVVTTAGASTNLPVTGAYSMSSEGRGTMVLQSAPGSTTFRFAMQPVTSGSSPEGRVIEFDDATGTGNRGSGSLALQAAATYSNATVTNGFAFGGSGASCSGRFAMAGAFTADGAGNLTSGAMDTNDAGIAASNARISGSYSVASNGRATLALTSSSGQPMHLSLYLNTGSSGTSFFFVDTDAPEAGAAKSLGKGEAQTGTFNTASLDAPAVIWTEGVDAAGADLTAGLFTGDGAGHATLTTDENDAGTIRANHFTWSYGVAANGRVTFATGSGSSPVLYLSGANSGYYVSADASAAAGAFEPQRSASFSTAAIVGAWSGGSSTPATPSASNSVLALSVDSSGNIVTTEDTSSLAGLQTLGTTDAINAVAPTGRLTFASASSVGWIVSGSHWILLDLTPGNTAATLIHFLQ